MTSTAADTPAVELESLRFAYRAGRDVLSIDHLSIARGETVFLHGPSGSGKTTLLGILAGVLQASSGRVKVLGQDFATMSNGARSTPRAPRATRPVVHWWYAIHSSPSTSTSSAPPGATVAPEPVNAGPSTEVLVHGPSGAAQRVTMPVSRSPLCHSS